MQLYSDKDITLAKEKLPDIIKEIDKLKMNMFEPTRDELLKANEVVLQFIRDNKRKMYGGTAMNALISNKNPEDAFYDAETHIADLDCYSPDPIVDMKKLANIIFDKGYKFVEGVEGQHEETYKVFSNFANVADISYCPRNIFYKIPFIELDGIQYVHPSFIMIDMYRMVTEPMFSSFRWEKTFPRIYLLQKHYPFNKATSPLPRVDQIKSEDETNVNILLGTVFDFIKNNDNLIVTGKYAYNVMLHESKIMDSPTLGKKYKYIKTCPYQFISVKYREDVKDLLDKLKQDNKTLASNISIVEHYPFWQLYGYSTYIYYKNYPICHIIHYNRRCTPFKKVDAYIFPDGKVGKEKGYVNIGTFPFNLLTNLCSAFYYRVNKNDELYQFYNIMTSHMVELRNYYLEKNNKTIFDNTLFQEFTYECKGDAIDPVRESRLIKIKKFSEGKPVIFRYKPENEYEDNPTTTYRFANSSGNPINNERNYRILGEDIPRKAHEEESSKEEEVEDSIELDAKDLEKAAVKKKLK